MPPVDRREYLKYTGSAALVPLVGTADSAASDHDGSDDANRQTEVLPPERLRVEYGEDPVGLDVEQPRMSWQFEPSRRGQQQGAYRILVASSEANLVQDVGNKWDSGKVSSGRSTNVEYDGEPLEAGEQVYWKVRVWDEDGRRPSQWSEPATWEMGLLEEGDWEADWIASSQQSNEDRISANQKQWTNYVVDTEFAFGEGPFGVLVRAQDSYNCYLAQLDPIGNEATGTPIPQFRLRVREHGQWSTVTEVPLTQLSSDDLAGTHRLRVQVSGDVFETYLDDQLIDRTSDATHSRGRPGFHVPEGGRAVVHDLGARTADGEVLYRDDFSTPERTRSDYSGGEFDQGSLHLDGTGVVLLHVFRPYVAPGPILRTEAGFDKEVVDARACISGLGFYELYLNGERIGDQVLDPGRTDYEETVLYATHDVTEYVQKGENGIGVALGRARFGAVPPTVVQWHTAPWWSDPQLRFQLDVEFADGTTRTVTSDDSWRVTDGPTRFDDLMFGEVYDARREREGWTRPGYDDGGWDEVRLVDAPAGTLRAQQVQPITVAEELTPVEVSEPEPGVFVYDLGQQIAGWPALTVAGERGADVKVKVGEKLNDDGTVWSRSPVNDAEIGEFTYVSSGNGRETWEPRFTYTGFRYVQLEGEGAPDAPTPEPVVGKVVHSAVTDGVASKFACSDKLLTQIHENTRWALRDNYHSVPTDTPTYEKRGWTGDAILTNETAIYEFWMPRFHTKRLRDLGDQQRQSQGGSLPEFAPSPLSPNDFLLRLGWESEYPVLIWWMYQYFGDERVLEEHYEGMKRYVRYVETHPKTINNLVHQVVYGDWSSPDVGRTPVDDEIPGEGDDCVISSHPSVCARDGTFFPPEGPDIVGNAWFYLDAKFTSRVAALLGHDEEADEFATLAEDIQEAFNTKFLYPDDVYRTGRTPQYRQTSNVMPLAFDMVPDDRAEAVVENLVFDIVVTHDGHLNTGVHGTKFLLEVLTEYGYHDVAYMVATQRTYPSWGWWIENDRTSLNEEWHLTERSRNHHFFGTIVDWFYQDLAGIRPDSAGFEHVDIAPKLVDDLTWVEATTDTVRGEVVSRWEQSAADLTLEVAVPGTATGTVRIPDLDAEAVQVLEGETTIWEGSQPVRPFPAGIESVERSDDAVVVEVGAGGYAFTLVPAEANAVGSRSDDGAIFTGGQSNRVELAVSATEPVRVRDRVPDGWTVAGGDAYRVYTVDGTRYAEFVATGEQIDVTYVARAPTGVADANQYTFGPIEVAGADGDWHPVSGTDDSLVVIGPEANIRMDVELG